LTILYLFIDTSVDKKSADAEGPRDAPQIYKFAHEKAYNRETTFKDTQGHRYQIGGISLTISGL